MRNRRGWQWFPVRSISLLALQLLLGCEASETRETLRNPSTGAAAPATPSADGGAAPVAQGAPNQSAPGAAPCSIGCSQLAVLKADLPADIERARHWRFQACRNEACFDGREEDDGAINDGVEGQYLYLLASDAMSNPTSPTTPVSFQLKRPDEDSRSYIEVVFDTAHDYEDGDRYVVRATDEDSGTDYDLFDERVAYKREQRQIGDNCALSCWHARVDTRAAADLDAGN